MVVFKHKYHREVCRTASYIAYLKLDIWQGVVHFVIN